MDLVGSVSRNLRGTVTGVKLESGGRIVAPLRWRQTAPSDLWIGCPWPLLNPRSVAVFPEDAWQARHSSLLLKLSDASNAGDDDLLEELENLEWHMNTLSEEMKVDKVGRMCLGSTLTSAVGLDKEAVLKGLGDHFRVFTPESARREEQRRRKVSEQTLRRLRMT